VKLLHLLYDNVVNDDDDDDVDDGDNHDKGVQRMTVMTMTVIIIMRDQFVVLKNIQQSIYRFTDSSFFFFIFDTRTAHDLSIHKILL